MNREAECLSQTRLVAGSPANQRSGSTGMPAALDYPSAGSAACDFEHLAAPTIESKGEKKYAMQLSNHAGRKAPIFHPLKENSKT